MPPEVIVPADLVAAVEERGGHRHHLALHAAQRGEGHRRQPVLRQELAVGLLEQRRDLVAGVVDEAEGAALLPLPVVSAHRAQAGEHLFLRGRGEGQRGRHGRSPGRGAHRGTPLEPQRKRLRALQTDATDGTLALRARAGREPTAQGRHRAGLVGRAESRTRTDSRAPRPNSHQIRPPCASTTALWRSRAQPGSLMACPRTSFRYGSTTWGDGWRRCPGSCGTSNRAVPLRRARTSISPPSGVNFGRVPNQVATAPG